MPEPYVVVLGDLNVDLTVALPDRAAPAAERIVREPSLTGGGTAGNTAAALARLGVAVEDRLVRAGRDARGSRGGRTGVPGPQPPA